MELAYGRKENPKSCSCRVSGCNLRYVPESLIRAVEKYDYLVSVKYKEYAVYVLSLDKVINGTLGVRSSTYNGYQWDEVMSAMSDVFLCGGDCVEDVNDGIIAYIENRDGNTPVKFHQADTLSRAFKLLHSYGLHIGIFRADCGSFSEDIHFTAVCAKWTRTSRRWWLNLYTGMPYDKLSFG